MPSAVAIGLGTITAISIPRATMIISRSASLPGNIINSTSLAVSERRPSSARPATCRTLTLYRPMDFDRDVCACDGKRLAISPRRPGRSTFAPRDFRRRPAVHADAQQTICRPRPARVAQLDSATTRHRPRRWRPDRVRLFGAPVRPLARLTPTVRRWSHRGGHRRRLPRNDRAPDRYTPITGIITSDQ